MPRRRDVHHWNNSQLEIGHLRFGEQQRWRWPWRDQDRTPAPKESISNASANGTFGEFDELKLASREAQDSIILFIWQEILPCQNLFLFCLTKEAFKEQDKIPPPLQSEILKNQKTLNSYKTEEDSEKRLFIAQTFELSFLFQFSSTGILRNILNKCL